MAREWRENILHLGEVNVCFVERSRADSTWRIWCYLPKMTCDSPQASREIAVAHAERLLDLWLHRAGLREEH